MESSDGPAAPSSRRQAGLARVLACLDSARRVVLSTHVNADGDGAGSQVALASFLARRGSQATIVNPTPFPEMFEFLREDLPLADPGTREGERALAEADLFVVLDTSEPSRLGKLPEAFRERPVVVLDHHPPNRDPLGDPAVRDPSACATGELVFDLFETAGERPTLGEAQAVYVAIVTDTGSFRFSNTTPRTHEIAARLVEFGVDPEAIYRRLYAQYTPARLRLIREALASLEVDPGLPLAWVSLTLEQVSSARADRDDMEGIVEYPRRLKGIEVAVLFREIGGGRIKASLRSNGEADVAAVARSLGGGGHAKAAGVVLKGPLAEARTQLLEAVRSTLRPLVQG